MSKTDTTLDADHRRSIAKCVMLGDTTIANICDAFLDGYENRFRLEKFVNCPYSPESGEHTAYLYGRALGTDQ